MSSWPIVACALVLGYLCMGRSFAYWGIPQWNVFAGDVILGLLLLCGPHARTGRWPWAGMRMPPFRRLAFWMCVSLAYGVCQVIRGWQLGQPWLTCVRDLAFHCYPFYLFLGVWVGLWYRGIPSRFVRSFAWINAMYGLAFVLFLTTIGWALPGVSNEVASVPVFGQPEHSGVVILALLAFEPNLRRVWHLLMLNAFVLLGMQIRAAWLGFLVTMIFWAWLTRRVGKLLWAAGAVAVLLGAMYVADIHLEGPQTRGASAFSSRDLVARAVAPFAPSLAADYSDNAQNYEDTAAWRTVWWAAIWTSVHETTESALLGHGYGYPLGDLNPLLDGIFIRTPHDVFFYVLGYTGWIGVGLFVLFQIELVRLLAAAYRQTGLAFGLIFWLALMVYACFTPFFEVPQGAIPFYLVVGWSLAPLLAPRPRGVPTEPAPLGAMPLAQAAG